MLNDSRDAWIAEGKSLGDQGRALPWAIGDWWIAGQGINDRKQIVRAPAWCGPAYTACRNYARVAAEFPKGPLRSDRLSITHHSALMAVPKTDRQALVEWALTEDKVPSVRALKAEIERRGDDRRNQQETGQGRKRSVVTTPASLARKVLQACPHLHADLRRLTDDADWEQFIEALKQRLEAEAAADRAGEPFTNVVTLAAPEASSRPSDRMQEAQP
jgi:hypothetical protein